jgi:putative transposase
VQAVKVVNQNYISTPEILFLLEEFRKMVNDVIRIGLAEKVTARNMLMKKAYSQLAKYTIPTYYRVTAVNKAVAMLKNYRKALRTKEDVKTPFCTKFFATDYFGFKIVESVLKVIVGKRKYVNIPLNSHTLSVISGYTVRSVTLTACTASIAFSKETATTDVMGLIGIDRNVDNITTATLDGKTIIYDLSGATKTKTLYSEVKSHFRRNDVRVAKKVKQKYGTKQKDKVHSILHNISKQIIEQAKSQSLGIVMENLKGIRKLYRKGNGQGREYRSRLNSWSFYELQRQIEYKAKWEGIPVFYVPPHGTSANCAICGSQITECAGRKVYCLKCDRISDRDENAALNIVSQGVRFALGGFTGEAMVPVKRWQVDVNQLIPEEIPR